MCAAIAGAVAIALRWISGPIADIVSAADSIAHPDYDVRVRVPEFGPAWVGETARAFNAMAKELDAQDQACRHLMADIAHELRTPLAVVQRKLQEIIAAQSTGLELRVIDTGTGITPQELPRIFDRFYKGAGSWDRVSG